MSGLEVFGVVIGGLPLVINSVQACKPHYQSAKTKDRDTAKTLQTLVDTLKRLHFLLRKDLDIILSSGSLPKEKIKEIMHQPHAIHFRDTEVLTAVHKALGDGFHTYISTLRRCGEVVMNLAGRLAGVTASSVPTRRKSSLKKKDLDRILEEMDHATVLLARIRVASTAASESERVPTPAPAAAPAPAPTPPVSQASPMGSPLDVLWQKADTLYGAIAAGFDQDCHEAHSAAISLQTGRELIDRFQKGDASISPGEIIVGLSLSGLEERFYVAGVNLAGSKASAQTKVSKHLCQVAEKAEAENTHLAISLSEDGNLFYGETKPPNATNSRNTPIPILSSLTSLNTILRHSPPGSWTIPQKVHLSFLIVSSVMQLCPTRWVNESISSNDIFLTPEDTHALTGTGPNRNSISHVNPDVNTNTITPTPFLLRTIPSTSNPRPKSISGPPTNRPGARFALLETAILLLEIWHQRPFEWYARGSGTPLRNAFWSRLKVAYEWLESSESKSVIVDFVLDVITRLIHCTFDSEQPSPEWGDSMFRGSFFRRVVLVLGEVDGSV